VGEEERAPYGQKKALLGRLWAAKETLDIDRIRTCAGEPKRFLISLLNHSDTMPDILNVDHGPDLRTISQGTI
jgi:hypothetical protein